MSKWAEERRVIDRGARKGRWSNELTPYLVEIMDCYTDPTIREIIFQKSSQVAGSELIMNCIGYDIEIDPTDMAYVAETEDKARAWAMESFDATVNATPILQRLVKTGDEDNNQRVKRFTGGQLIIAWASSPSQLSSRPLQKLFFDEKAAYKVTKEGDAVKLGEARTKTYAGYEKVLKVSSPRSLDDSADIAHDYARGDQREYYVPCPSCDFMQTLKWANVKWESNEPDTAYMVCEGCGVMLENDDLPEMLMAGKWIAHAPFNGIASFKINQLYSLLMGQRSWAQMVADFLEAKKFKSTLQVWTNTALGESWKPEERIDYADLSLQKEDYESQVPVGVLVLTAGVDVQGDRLECEIVGWGRDHESWSIDYRILNGDPSQSEVWEQLSDHLTAEFQGENGKVFRVQCACIDSGFHTNQVYRFCKANAGRRWFAVKGMGEPHRPLISKATWAGQNPKVRLFPVGTNAAKDEIFSFLQVAEPGPGFCHFPHRPEYDDAYLKQLCSEKKTARHRMGREFHVYEKVSMGVRNEALDLRVYATAARAILNPNYEAIARRRLDHPEVADREVEPWDETPENPKSEIQTPKSAVVPFRRIRQINDPFQGTRL